MNHDTIPFPHTATIYRFDNTATTGRDDTIDATPTHDTTDTTAGDTTGDIISDTTAGDTAGTGSGTDAGPDNLDDTVADLAGLAPTNLTLPQAATMRDLTRHTNETLQRLHHDQYLQIQHQGAVQAYLVAPALMQAIARHHHDDWTRLATSALTGSRPANTPTPYLDTIIPDHHSQML